MAFNCNICGFVAEHREDLVGHMFIHTSPVKPEETPVVQPVPIFAPSGSAMTRTEYSSQSLAAAPFPRRKRAALRCLSGEELKMMSFK